MMNKANRINKYRIVIEQIFDPGADINDVRVISMDVYSKTIDDAVEKAWNTLNLKKEEYEITLIESMNRPHYRNNCEPF